jgi:hypothetical protein
MDYAEEQKILKGALHTPLDMESRPVDANRTPECPLEEVQVDVELRPFGFVVDVWFVSRSVQPTIQCEVERE